MHPLRPFGIQPIVLFLVLWFEDTKCFSLVVLDKVTSTGTLIYPLRVHSLVDGALCCPDELCEG